MDAPSRFRALLDDSYPALRRYASTAVPRDPERPCPKGIVRSSYSVRYFDIGEPIVITPPDNVIDAFNAVPPPAPDFPAVPGKG